MKKQYRQKVWIVLLTITGLAVLNCGDPKKSPLGSDYFGRDLLDVTGPVWFTQQSAQAVQDTSQANDKGSLLYVYQGDGTDHQVQSVIKFAPPDSGTINQATLELIQDTVSMTGAVITLYEWTQTWQDAVDAGTPLDMAPLGQKLTDVMIETTDYDTLTIALDPAVISAWTDTSGFILVSNATNLTASFYSNDNAYTSPTLNFLMDSDTTETVKYPVKDWFITNRPQNNDQTTLMVDNGTSQRIRLIFDISSLAEDATINRARLWLHIAKQTVTPFPNLPFTLRAYLVTADSSALPDYDSSTYITGVVSGDSVAVELQSLCQNWSTGLKDNLGVLLIGAGEKTAITRCAIITNGGSALNPRLEVYYSPSAIAPETP